jgi:hypothetical protein
VLTVVAFVAIAFLVALVAHERTFGSGGTPTLHGSGTAAAQTRALPPFTGVMMAGDLAVVIRVGAPQKVVVTADDNLLSTVKTGVRAGTLNLTTPGSFSAVTPMRVAISVPYVDALRLSGTGLVVATGEIPTLDATLDGTGAMRLSGLVARDVRATLSGTGAMTVTATRSLDAALPGTGQITYNGTPAQVTQSITGTGAVVRGAN